MKNESKSKARLLEEIESLRQGEATLESIFRAAPVGIGLVSKRRLLQVNQRLCDMVGYAKADLVGKSARMLYPTQKEFDHVGKEKYRQISESGKGTVETRFKRGDGRVIDVLLSSVPLDPADLAKGVTFTALDITERKTAERALRSSEKKYRELYENIRDGSAETDMAGKIVRCNQEFLRMLGYTREEVQEKTYEQITPEKWHAGEARIIRQQVMKRGYSDVYEKEYHRKDGSLLPIEIRTYLIRDDQDRPSGMWATVRDISRRKQAEDLLRMRETQQEVVAAMGQKALAGENLASLMDDIVLKVAQTLKVEYCKILEMLPGEEDMLLKAGVGWKKGRVGRAVVSTGTDSQAGYTLLATTPVIVDDLRTETRFSGPQLLIEHEVVSGMSVAIPGRREPFGVLGAHTKTRRSFTRDDVNFLQAVASILAQGIERKRAEQALQESEEKYRKVIAHATEAICVAQDGRLQFYNPKTIQILGYPPEKLTAMPFLDFIHPVDRPMLAERHARRLRGENVQSVYPFRIVDSNGRVKWMEINAVLIEWEGRAATLNFISDISERKRAEDQIKNSLKEKEVMLREIHHRVKNNMQIISSLLRLQTGAIQDPEALEKFKESQNRIRTMALIHESLYQSQDLAKIDFAKYINKMATHLHSMYVARSGRIQLKVDVKDVYLDINRAIPCGLIINELVSNAIKHGFPGGKKGKIRIEMRTSQENKHILRIQDDGIGITDGVGFEESETLGMQLVTDLVNQLQGTIDLEKQAGTVFIITFP